MARKLIVEILGDSSSLERSFARSSASAKKFEQQTTGPIGKVDKAFGKLQGIRAGAFAGGAAASAAIVGIQRTTEAASDLQEQITKGRQVFDESAASVEKWSRSTARSIGVSQTAALEATGTFGNLFTAIGTSTPEAAKMSRALVELAADLASFNNASIEDTLAAIRSGLVGEAEPLRRYGVLLSEARVAQVAMAQTGKDNAKALTVQEKAAARVAIIFKDTAQAQGDFARTSGGLANQQRILSAQVQELEANLGTLLLPTITELTTALNDAAAGAVVLVKGLGKLADVRIPPIEIPIVGKDIPGTGSKIGGLLGDALGLALKAEGAVVFGPMFAAGLIASKIAGGEAGAAYATEFAAALKDPRFQFTVPAPEVETPTGKTKGFGSGLTPEDIFGPKFFDIPRRFQDALLDIEFKGGDPRATLNKALDVIISQLARPDLTPKQKSALKEVRNRIKAQIEAADTAATQAVEQAGRDRQARIDKANQKAKDAATKQRQGFDNLISNLELKLDAAQISGGFKKQKQASLAIEKAIIEQIRIEGRTPELVKQLFDQRQETQAITEQQMTARQFKAIGLGAEGDMPLPTLENLRKQFASLEKRIQPGDISAGMARRFKQIGKFLAGNIKDLKDPVAEAIRDFFKEIRGEFDQSADNVFRITPATSAINKNAIVEGLGLDRATELELRDRLSGINRLGRKLAPTTGTTGAFGITITQPPINVSTTVNLDGQAVARNTTIHQQKGKRSNPPQKRGPLGGI